MLRRTDMLALVMVFTKWSAMLKKVVTINYNDIKYVLRVLKFGIFKLKQLQKVQHFERLPITLEAVEAIFRVALCCFITTWHVLYSPPIYSKARPVSDSCICVYVSILCDLRDEDITLSLCSVCCKFCIYALS